MHQVPGKVGPGVDLNEELRKLHSGEPLSNAVGEGVGACRSGAHLQRCQHELIFLDPQVTALACQEPFDLGHRALQLGFARVEALQPLTGRPGEAHDLWPPARPLTRGNEIGVRVGIAPAMLDPDIAGAEGAAEGP
jgi:hypothetical protein